MKHKRRQSRRYEIFCTECGEVVVIENGRGQCRECGRLYTRQKK